MVLNISALTVDDAVDIIVNTIHLPRFLTTPASQMKIENLALAAEVHSSLFEYPNAKVNAREGAVIVTIKAPLDQKQEIITNVRNIIKDISGVKEIDVRFEPYL